MNKMPTHAAVQEIGERRVSDVMSCNFIVSVRVFACVRVRWLGRARLGYCLFRAKWCPIIQREARQVAQAAIRGSCSSLSALTDDPTLGAEISVLGTLGRSICGVLVSTGEDERRALLMSS